MIFEWFDNARRESSATSSSPGVTDQCAIGAAKQTVADKSKNVRLACGILLSARPATTFSPNFPRRAPTFPIDWQRHARRKRGVFSFAQPNVKGSPWNRVRRYPSYGEPGQRVWLKEKRPRLPEELEPLAVSEAIDTVPSVPVRMTSFPIARAFGCLKMAASGSG